MASNFRLITLMMSIWKAFGGGAGKALDEAKKAQDMGCPICLCTYPPSIMQRNQNETEFRCQNVEDIHPDSATVGNSDRCQYCL